MAFTRFDARLAKVSYGDTVKAWLKVRADQTSTLTVTMSGVMASNFAALDAAHVGKTVAADLAAWCEVFTGDGEDEGKLELHFCFGPGRSDEAVEVRGGVHGLRRLTLRAPPGMPQFDTNAEACRVVSHGETLVIELPVKAWERQRATRVLPTAGASSAAPAGPRTPAPEPTPPARIPPAATKANGGHRVSQGDDGAGDFRIDAVKYLGKKGVILGQTEFGDYTRDGAPIATDQVVTMINAHRKDAGLKAITERELA